MVEQQQQQQQQQSQQQQSQQQLQQQPRASSSRRSGSSGDNSTQPMDVHNANGVTPFLHKTYEMVNDPSTDAVISWNDQGNSFIVWNVQEFSKEFLPKSFKHNNFSSFVRQLNTYNFRKVDPDRWEFANEGFVRGRKDLLRGIHRKKGQQTVAAPPVPAQAQPQKNQATSAVEVGMFGIEGEIERLKRDKNVLMGELVRLRQQQQKTDRDLQIIVQRLHMTEQRQQQMVTFLAKAMQSPSFLSQLVQQNENKKRLATAAARKKRRLPKDREPEAAADEEPSTSPTPIDGQIVKYQPNANDAVAMFVHLLNSVDLSTKMDIPNLSFQTDGVSLADMHRSRIEDLSQSRMMKELTDSFEEEQMNNSSNSNNNINNNNNNGGSDNNNNQIQPAGDASLLMFDNVEMEDRDNGSSNHDADSSSIPLEDVLGDIPEDDEFWHEVLDGDVDFGTESGMDALNGMESLTLLP